jgi:hypothetical protein
VLHRFRLKLAYISGRQLTLPTLPGFGGGLNGGYRGIGKNTQNDVLKNDFFKSPVVENNIRVNNKSLKALFRQC